MFTQSRTVYTVHHVVCTISMEMMIFIEIVLPQKDFFALPYTSTTEISVLPSTCETKCKT